MIEDYGEYKVFNTGIGESLTVDCGLSEYIEVCLDSHDVMNCIRFTRKDIKGVAEAFCKMLLEWESEGEKC